VIWAPAPPFKVKSIAVAPANENHTKHLIDRTIIAPKTYSGIVRPLEIRVKSRPKKGANAIHHAQ
jgi:hypothetical protein